MHDAGSIPADLFACIYVGTSSLVTLEQSLLQGLEAAQHCSGLQAQQLSAQASSYIEAFSKNATGSCGSKRGKRKLTEMSQALTRRLGDLLTEGQQYVTQSPKHVRSSSHPKTHRAVSSPNKCAPK